LKLDKTGKVIPYNDTSIPAESDVFRGVSEQHIVVGHDGKKRISTAFLEPSSLGRDPYQGISIDIETKMLSDEINPVNCMSEKTCSHGKKCYLGVISFTTSSFRDLDFLVGYDPLPTNPFHGGVWQNGANKMTKGKRKRILRNANWLIEIDNVSIFQN